MHAADGSVMSCNFLVGAGNTGHGVFVDSMGVQYDIAENAFGKWMKTQSKTPKEVRDPVADALVAALSNLSSDKRFKLGNKGYVVRRSKGKGVSGFVAQKVT
jgi:hypothetical protein